MAKQEVVIRVTKNDQKSRSKALKIVVGTHGVESASLKGDEKREIEVIGEGIDPVGLTNSLRKNLCHAELVSVGEAKKEENKPAEAAQTPQQTYVGYPYYVYEVPPRHCDPSCTIM